MVKPFKFAGNLLNPFRATEIERRGRQYEQDEFDGGLSTGTPPLAGTRGFGLFGPLGSLGGAANWIGSGAVLGGEVSRQGTSGSGIDVGEVQDGVTDAWNDSTPDAGGGPWWLPVGAFMLLLAAVWAFSGGLAEGLTE